MKKILNSIILVCSLIGLAFLENCCENEKDKLLIQITQKELPEGLPTVTTSIDPESITATRVVVVGNVINEGNAPVFRRGFEMFNYPDYNNPRLEYNSSGKGKFTYEITGLWPGNSYRIRAYAINSLGTTYGNDVGFSTPIPNITTNLVTEVSQTNATVVGSVTMINISDIFEGGICYGTLPAPNIEGFKIVCTNSSGIYNCKLQNLIPGTLYYVRAYVSGHWYDYWPWGTLPAFYGNEITFTTREVGNIP
jgi:hypothetical protein